MLYFVVISSSFRKSSLDEIKKEARFRIVSEFNNFLIIDSRRKDLHEKLANAVFTSSIFPLFVKKKIPKGRYLETVMSAISATKISKEQALKLECIDINSKEGYSAKDIEVRTGLLMEKKGYNINIVTPEILGYVVLFDGICYAGYASYNGLQRKYVNPYRHYHTEKKVSRSELKLKQAFDEFGITGTGIALDLGAAPGGWSVFLAKEGFKVIAIDSAELDKKAIKSERIVMNEAGKNLSLAKALKSSDIIHIKKKVSEALGRVKVREISLLADDMNIDLKSTASAIKPYLKLLKDGAYVVITVKCITKNAPKYLRDLKSQLGKSLIIKGIKVLPANRQEVTVFCIKRSGK